MPARTYELVGYYNGERVQFQRNLGPAEAGRLARFYYGRLAAYYGAQNAVSDLPELPRLEVTFSPDGHEVRFGTPAGTPVAAAVYVRESAS